ncbi:MAG: hypothetical protein AABZ80_05025 [Gemmatimonadota bacterium]
MRRWGSLRMLALLSLVATASCDLITGKKDGSFTLTLSDATLSVGQGKKDTIGIALARTNFDKPITLSVDGVPSGMIAVLLPKTVPGTAQASSLELTVDATAAIATSTLTVRATAEGVVEQTQTVGVSVAVTGAFTLSAQGFPATAAQGGGAIGTVLVVRSGGHADNVTLAATGLPTGVTASFADSPTLNASISLSFSVAGSVAAGAYPITITGSAGGLANQTLQITLNVIAPPATASLSMPFCASSLPAWFAYQNQGFPWQVITPVNGVYTFQATATLTVAYAFVAGPGVNETDFSVLYATRAELAGQTDRDCAGPKTLTGSVTGATTSQSIRVAMGASTATPTAASPNFSLTGVASRALDLIATKGTIASTSLNIQVTPDMLIVQRNLNPADGATLGTLDFAGQGFAPASSNLTVNNVGTGDNINIGSTFWSATNTYGIVHALQPTNTSNTLFSMPAGKLQAGDFHELVVETYQTGFAFGRVNVAYLGALADRTETLAPNLSTPGVNTISASPYTRLRGQLPVQAEYPTAARFIFFQAGGNAADRLVYVVATAGFLGGTPASNWDVAIPEFGLVAGLNNSWLPSTSFVLYQAEAYSAPGPVLFGGVPSVGDVVRAAYRVTSSGTVVRAALRAIDTRQYLRR